MNIDEKTRMDMSAYVYHVPVKERKTREVTYEEILEKEKVMDEFGLNQPFKYKGKKILTYGDLRKIATSLELIESLEEKMDDDDYCYIWRWYNWNTYM